MTQTSPNGFGQESASMPDFLSHAEIEQQQRRAAADAALSVDRPVQTSQYSGNTAPSDLTAERPRSYRTAIALGAIGLITVAGANTYMHRQADAFDSSPTIEAATEARVGMDRGMMATGIGVGIGAAGLATSAATAVGNTIRKRKSTTTAMPNAAAAPPNPDPSYNRTVSQ